MARTLPPLFDGINDVDVQTGLRHFEERTVEEGDVVMRAGEPARSLICVLDGVLGITAGGEVVGTAGPGEIVGEMALFHESTRTATVRALEPSRLLVLPREGYERMRDVMHPLGVAIEKHALELQLERLRKLSDRISKLAPGGSFAPKRPADMFFAAIRSLFGGGGAARMPQTINPVATLRASPFFADAPADALGSVARAFSAAAYGAGHLLCTEGEVGHEMYILAEGLVDVVVSTTDGKVQALATLDPGDAFGMIALAQGRPRTATCVAQTDVVVLVLSAQAWTYLAEEPYLAGSVFRRALLRGMSEQITYSNTQLAEFESKSKLTSLERARAAIDTHSSTWRR